MHIFGVAGVASSVFLKDPKDFDEFHASLVFEF